MTANKGDRRGLNPRQLEPQSSGAAVVTPTCDTYQGESVREKPQGTVGNRTRPGNARGRLVGDDQKTCMGCHETKPLEAFYRNRLGLAGRQSRCKPCFRLQLEAPENYPQRKAARDAVRHAVRSGRLTRPSHCSACGREAYAHGHHDDYAKPLDVRWLCKPCHEEHHRGEKYERHDTALPVAS